MRPTALLSCLFVAALCVACSANTGAQWQTCTPGFEAPEFSDASAFDVGRDLQGSCPFGYACLPRSAGGPDGPPWCVRLCGSHMVGSAMLDGGADAGNTVIYPRHDFGMDCSSAGEGFSCSTDTSQPRCERRGCTIDSQCGPGLRCRALGRCEP